jgi:3,4-dihydroxy-2-butanone 4-phosphate synthase
MRADKQTNHEELRRPGMRRVLEAIEEIENERPGLLEGAVLAARVASKNRGDDGGRMSE